MRYNRNTGDYELAHTLNDPYYQIPRHLRDNPRVLRYIIEEHRKAYHSVTMIDLIPEAPDFVGRMFHDAGRVCIIDDAPDIPFFGQRLHHGFVGGILITIGQLFGTIGKLMAMSGGFNPDDLTPEEIEQYAGPLEEEREPIYMGQLPQRNRPQLPPPVEEQIPEIPGIPI